jgi:dihydropteroate synthase
MQPATGQKFALAAAIEAVDNGADIVDLGAESTRPNATPLTSDQEQARLLPVLEGLLRERPTAVVSVDTYHAATATAALRAGAEIVNDVSGLSWDEGMAEVVAAKGSGLVLMHTRGRPADWAQQSRLNAEEVVPAVFAGLMERLTLAEAAGIADERIVIDPGFGFGKRGAENFALLAGFGRLHELGRPLLAGVSRKSFLGDAVSAVQPAGLPNTEARRVATVAGNVAAALAGAHILRVHDLQAAREAAAVADAVLEAGNK